MVCLLSYTSWQYAANLPRWYPLLGNCRKVTSIAVHALGHNYDPSCSLATISPISGVFVCNTHTLPIAHLRRLRLQRSHFANRPIWWLLRLRLLCSLLHIILQAICNIISLRGIILSLTLHRSCLYTDVFILWPCCRPFVFTPSHMVSDLFRHAHRQLNPLPLISKFLPFRHSDFYFIAICQESYALTRTRNSLPYMLTLWLRSLLPFRHTITSSSHKDLCLYKHCLLWVSHSHKSFFSRPIAIMLQCVLALSVWFPTTTCSRHFLPLLKT